MNRAGDREEVTTTDGFSRSAGRIFPRLGRVSRLLLVVLAVLSVGAFLIARLAGSSGESGLGEEAAALEPARGQRDSGRSSVEIPLDSPRASGLREREREREVAATRLPSFDGVGSIRGLVTVVGGDPLPESFTVHVGPSTSLFGREHAELRSLAVQGPEFALAGLPLGGYDVWVEVSGMNSLRTPVLLSAAAPDPYIVLRVSPTGYIDGYVVNRDGRPAQDLRVALEAMFGEGRLETTTRGDGFYRFEDVQDGEYRILFGPLHAPLLPARELAFQAPSMRFPRTELPAAADILLHSTDPGGRAVGDVTLTGFGKPTGRIELVTDFAGDGWARNVPPGRYRLAARDAEGRRGTSTIEVEDRAGQEFWISVR
jgi:hypothetical protein